MAEIMDNFEVRVVARTREEARAEKAKLFSLHIAHARGVADGAGRRAMSKSEHRAPDQRAAYERGYATGKRLAQDACDRYAAEIGYAPAVAATDDGRYVRHSEGRR